jgi:hypothetical protein
LVTACRGPKVALHVIGYTLRGETGAAIILSRLELLCKDVGRPLVFEIGHFELRGFRQHQSVYGLCQGGEVPSNPKRPISPASVAV